MLLFCFLFFIINIIIKKRKVNKIIIDTLNKCLKLYKFNYNVQINLGEDKLNIKLYYIKILHF